MGPVVQSRDAEAGAQCVPVDDDGQVRGFPGGAGTLFGGAGQPANPPQRVGVALRGDAGVGDGVGGGSGCGELSIRDRNAGIFFSFELWAQYLVTGADLLWRVTTGITPPVTELLPDGSYLSVINSKKTRSADYWISLSAVDDPRDATHIPVRVIEYTVTGDGTEPSQVFRLVTTILNPHAVTALELTTAYQQRWEYEMSLREIETQLLEPEHGLRSKTPELVRQEFWALLLAHYAIRALMTEAADTAEIDPDRLSFIRTLNIVRRQVTNQAGFSP